MKNASSWQRAIVEDLRELSPTVREIALRPEGGTGGWSAGSHLDVRVQAAGGDDVRSYSLIGIAADSASSGLYRIAVKRAQPGRGGSRFMWSLRVGDALQIGEPANHFEIALDAPASLIVAGGIGVTPLVGIAQTLAARGAALAMRYAARSGCELVYASSLKDLLGDRLQTFCSDRGERLDLDAEIAQLAPGGQLVVCGPVSLLDAARDAWTRAGRDPALLRFETFGSGAGEARPFWVELPRHGLRIEVPPDRSLLDALNEAGIETLSDCRRGECGLCAMDIVAAQGTIDHRDVFFSAEQKRANRQLCACVSRVEGGGIVLDSAYRAE
ncbi:MAG TPA: PDR/VanB family oxidoreductase [Albitalea sp.]|nr:PDR/VanB family oxidoreductase [Albitalea sp.]